MSEQAQGLSKELLEILVCPLCKGDLAYDNDELRCLRENCGLVYSIRDGIPVMLIEEAKLPEGVDDLQVLIDRFEGPKAD